MLTQSEIQELFTLDGAVGARATRFTCPFQVHGFITMSVNSQHLTWFHQIEKALWSFFALFGDLCDRCARHTLTALSAGERKGRETWCCCMIDNQVHDNWETLNAVQTRFDRRWYDSMRRAKGVRSLGNGPCPALGDQGCRLKKCRPITCTTQLCSKMLLVLNNLGVIQTSTHAALQIEDLIALPDILPDLYGTRKGRKVSRSDVDRYLSEVRRLHTTFAKAMTDPTDPVQCKTPLQKSD